MFTSSLADSHGSYFRFCEARNAKQLLNLICYKATMSIEEGKRNSLDQLNKYFLDECNPQTMPHQPRQRVVHS